MAFYTFPALQSVAAVTASYSSTAPPSPSETGCMGYFDGCGDDNEGYSPSASSGHSSFSPVQYAERRPESKKDKIPRPPNAWILYRSSKLAEFKEHNPQMYIKPGEKRSRTDRGTRPTQANMSKAIAEMWAQEPPSVKEHYHKEAMLRSVMHAVDNPGYRFNPNKGRNKRPVKKEKSPKCEISPAPTTVQEPAGNEQLQAISIPDWQDNTQGYKTEPISPYVTLSPTHTRRPSLEAKLSEIFSAGDALNEALGYGSSSASSSSSANWTPELLPSFPASDMTSFANMDLSTTPFSEHSDNFSGSFSDYTPCTTAMSESFSFAAPAPCLLQAPVFPASPMEGHMSNQYAMSGPSSASVPDWWSLRNVRVRLDHAEGVPLEELLRSLAEGSGHSNTQ